MDHLADPVKQLSDMEEEEEAGAGNEIMIEVDEKADEEDQSRRGWGYLTHVCLRLVFRWLQDRDRVRAVLVCRHWYHVMHSPSLWRVRTINFSGRILRKRCSELEIAVCYAKVFGNYLEDLEICITPPLNSIVSRRIQQTLRTFLAELRRTGGHLRSLNINHMELDRAAWCLSVRNSLIRSLTCYLKKEGSRLGHLSLQGARLDLPHGLEVLEAVASAQQHVHMGRRSGIIHLNLEDYFSRLLEVHSNPSFAHVMSRFRGLSTLTLNYSCVSDGLLAALSAACRNLWGGGSLRTFTLRCHVHEPHMQRISGDSWVHQARHCPDLQVRIMVERILSFRTLRQILLKEIPLKCLSLTSCYFREQGWSIKPTLSSILPQYGHCLQKLALDLNNSHESVDEEILDLVQLCPRLVYLKVWAFLHISFLDFLLQKRLEKKCCLGTIKVRIYTSKHETHDKNQQLEEVFSRYKQLIHSELNFSAITFPMP